MTNIQDLHIVGMVGVWNEGERLKYVIGSLMKHCNEIVIIMDYPDEETEKFVLRLASIFKSRIKVGYTSVPPLKNPKNLKRRYKVYQSQLVEDRLKLVKEIHEEHPIDILLTPDSDEMYTDEFPFIIEKFWTSRFTSMALKSIDVYDTMEFLHNKGMMSHYRIFKYRPDAHFTPRRYQDFLQPYRGRDAWKGYMGGFVHLSQHRDFAEMRARLRNPRLVDVSPNAKIWRIGFDPVSLGSKQYQAILKTEPTCLLKDYERLFAKS